MSKTKLDKELVQAYIDDKLWKIDSFYYSLLELVVDHTLNHGTVDRQILNVINKFSVRRKQLVLEKSFSDDGKVNITCKKESLWQKIKRSMSISKTA